MTLRVFWKPCVSGRRHVRIHRCSQRRTRILMKWLCIQQRLSWWYTPQLPQWEKMLPTWWRELTWLWKKGYNWSFTRFLRIWNQCRWSFSLTISPKTPRILKFGRVTNLFREVSVYHGISTLMSSPSRYLLIRSHLLDGKFCLRSTAYLNPPPPLDSNLQ